MPFLNLEDTGVFSTSQRRELSLGEAWELTQGHTENKYKCSDPNPAPPDSGGWLYHHLTPHGPLSPNLVMTTARRDDKTATQLHFQNRWKLNHNWKMDLRYDCILWTRKKHITWTLGAWPWLGAINDFFLFLTWMRQRQIKARPLSKT